jgi:cysteine desulfurase/selenocysteine lyase
MNYKKDFPIFKNNPNLVYLDSAATSQKPLVVIDSVTEFYETYNSNIHRGLYPIAEKASTAVEEVRKKVARFINARHPEEIIFIKNATEGLNLIARSWGEVNIREGDEVVATTMEHHANFVPWQQLAKKKHSKFSVLDIDDTYQLDVSQLTNPKLFAVTHVSNVLGTVNSVKEIIAKIKNKDSRSNSGKTKIVVDASQSVPHMKIDVQDMNCDFLVFTGHKMFAETGVGVLYGKKELLEKMPPFLMGGDMIREVTIADTVFADLPNKLEAGTLNISGIISFGAAIDYIESLEFETIQKHERELMKYAIEKLQLIEGLKIYGPAENRLGIISFSIDGVHPHDIAQLLGEKNICVRAGHHCAMPLHNRLGVPATTRVSLQVYNDEKDINTLIATLREIVIKFKQ